MKVLLPLLTMLLMSNAHAGMFVEPMITYENGSHTTDYPAPFSNASGTATGMGLGARLGFHFAEIVFAGLDARYSLPEFKDSSINYSAKSTAINWGPVIGVQMPIVGLRAFGSYVWGGSLDPEASGGYDVKFEKASGFRLGGGFQIIAFSLNLEYQEINYASASIEQAGPFAPGSFGDPHMRNKSWILSISFPMEM